MYGHSVLHSFSPWIRHRFCRVAMDICHPSDRMGRTSPRMHPRQRRVDTPRAAIAQCYTRTRGCPGARHTNALYTTAWFPPDCTGGECAHFTGGDTVGALCRGCRALVVHASMGGENIRRSLNDPHARVVRNLAATSCPHPYGYQAHVLRPLGYHRSRTYTILRKFGGIKRYGV